MRGGRLLTFLVAVQEHHKVSITNAGRGQHNGAEGHEVGRAARRDQDRFFMKRGAVIQGREAIIQSLNKPIVRDALDDDRAFPKKERLSNRVAQGGLNREQRVAIASGSHVVGDASFLGFRTSQMNGPDALQMIAVNEKRQVGAVNELVVRGDSLEQVDELGL